MRPHTAKQMHLLDTGGIEKQPAIALHCASIATNKVRPVSVCARALFFSCRYAVRRFLGRHVARNGLLANSPLLVYIFSITHVAT